MSLITAENISKRYTIAPLFQSVSFGLEPEGRVGLIGANGSGKTTLLRIMAGVEEPDTGRVYRSGSPLVGYLPQNPPFDPDETALDAIFSSTNQTLRLLHDYEQACLMLEREQDRHDIHLAEISRLSEKLDAAGAWGLETEAKIILNKLGITDTSVRMGTLSGGGRKRVAMAHALIERPDLLILDEPTNHLDADSVEWLEEYLKRYSGALLLVTHDRYFLDRVTNRILEIDRGSLRSYAGNYSYFLEKKEEEEERLEVEEHKRKMLAREELAWLRRGAKARTTKQKARIDRANTLLNTAGPETKGEIDISLASRRLGKKILEIHGVSKSYGGRTLIDDFTHVLQPGERVGIIGPNGIGKSTLMEIIVGRVAPDSGRVEVGETVVIGYFDQESRALDDEIRVIDYIKEIAEHIRTADGAFVSAGQMLERFLFPSSLQYAMVGTLSGGERRRLYLLRLLMSAPNVLILDEPTNDFDIETLQALESYLDGFDGCVVVVSHDRYFLDRTVDHLFRFEGDGIVRDYPGNYSAYLDIRGRQAEQIAAKAPPKLDRAPTPKPADVSREDGSRPLSYKEKKELDGLEKRIEQAEERKRELETRLGQIDYQAARELAAELESVDMEIATAMERWEALAARM